MYEKELENLGLGEKETKVYLASLELGADTAQNIAKKAGINRATTYVQIDSLKDKGLMSEFEKGKKTFYVAESPDRLSGLFKTFEAQLDVRKSELQRILPALLDMFSGMGERPRVRFYEGQEGVRMIRQDFLKIKDKIICGFTNLDRLFKFSPEYEKEYIKYRVDNDIHLQVIYTSKKGAVPDANDPARLREAKFLEYDKFPVTADITIYDNKVAIEAYKSKQIGIMIESDEIANAMKCIFKNLWDRM